MDQAQLFCHFIHYIVNLEMDKQEQVRRFTDQILNRIKTSFENHKRRIDKQNAERGFSGGMKNEAAQNFYNPLADIVQNLQNLLKLVAKSSKLKKQRSTMYDKKIRGLIESLQMIRKNRHMVKIKINEHLVRLINQTSNIVQEAQNHLRKFDKQSSQICGNAYSFKPAVEISMTQIAQYSFLWSNLVKLESITNDSVNQILIPVPYQQSQFRSIQNQVRANWPNPEIIQKKIKVAEVPIKDDNELRQAHECLYGFTRPQNSQRAIQIYQKQSEKSNYNPTALNALGAIYESGKFIRKDMNKAVIYYKKSADKNDPEGLYKIGQYLEKGYINSKQIFQGLYPNREAQIRGGIQFYQKAAKLGHLDAITDLGYIYEKGVKAQNSSNFFIQPHPEHALKYYLKAKKMQFPRAYNNLGALLITCPLLSSQAEGGNLLKGIKYLEKGVDLKYPKAFLNLGKCYENGVGVAQNIDRARALYLQGAEMNEVQCKLNYVKSCLGNQIDDEAVMIKMVEMARQVLNQNFMNAEALYYMGLFLEQGIGIDKNTESSVFYINSAARLEYPPALNKLADFYYSGYGVKKDYQYAKLLYEKAASKGDSKALINLGVMMQKGIGYEKDQKKAYELYEEAAALGNPDALIILSTTSNGIKPSQAVKKANDIGSLEAAKILNSTHIFAPQKAKVAQSYTENLKTLQNFYIKNNENKQKRK